MPRENFTAVHVAFDPGKRTLTPINGDADAFFGLRPGTNGTAATMRRAVVEAHYRGTETGSGPMHWVRADGARPTGINLVPNSCSDTRFTDPWSGK